jgi:hypothetical protein
MYYRFNCTDDYRFAETFNDLPLNVYDLNCSYCNLTSLEGCPLGISKLDCSHCNLTSLKGCPSTVEVLICNNNYLTSLEGCPIGIDNLHCCNNYLTSLEGFPNLRVLLCTNNHLASLEGCPFNISYLEHNCPSFNSIISPAAKLNIKHGIFLEKVARLMQYDYYHIHGDPTRYLPQDLYDEIMNLPICPKCNKRGLLIHTIELKNKYGIKIPVKTCCY